MHPGIRTALCAAVVGIGLAGHVSLASASVEGPLGAFNDEIPIAVPSFHDIAPTLSLAYDSSERNSWTGVGWRLKGVGRIERASAGRGAPLYDSTDIFILDGVADGDELYPCQSGSVSPSCTSGGTHSTRSESYSKITFAGSGASSRWTFVAKDGTKSIYAPVYTVSNGADNTAGTSDDVEYKWGLVQVVDTKNNVVNYGWTSNQIGCCWDQLDTVTYNGTTIKFYYESRSDVEQLAIGGSYGLTSIYGRIKTIDVSVSGSRLRSYKLGYTTSSATSRSLLTSVQQFGKDATLDGSGTVTAGTSLPAATLGYQTGSVAFAAGTSDTAMTYSTTYTRTYVPLDINGDGKTDVVEFSGNGTYYLRRSWINSGSGFTDATGLVGTIPYHADTQFLAGDINGDGKGDIIEFAQGTSGQFTRRTWISDGTNFTQSSSRSPTGYSSSKFFAADLDGDGKTDILETRQDSACGFCTADTYRLIWISTGTDFTLAYNGPQGTGWSSTKRFVPMDVNGDGKTDYVAIQPQDPGVAGQTATSAIRHMYLSTGTGFLSGTDDTISYGTSTSFFALDVNGDGKSDMVEVYDDGTSSRRKTWLSTGFGFVLSSADTGIAPLASTTQLLTTDVNGDGRTDLLELFVNGTTYTRRPWISNGTGFVAAATDSSLAYDASYPSRLFATDNNGDGLGDILEFKPSSTTVTRRAWNIGGAFPDLLSSRTTGLGGTTTVSYTPSTAWTSTNDPPIRQTVSSVTTNDGRGNTATTSYSYSGGLFDWIEHRFLGFRYQKETKPCITGEATCPYSERWFRQDLNAARMLERLDQRSGSGTLLASTINEYTTNGSTLPWTALPTGTWQYTYTNSGSACPGADCKRTYKSRTFNAYGEVTQEVDYGDYDVSGDERTTTATFVPNTSAYIVRFPADVKVFSGVGVAGTLLNETLSYYDSATTWNQAPSAGFLTQIAQWLSSPSSFVVTKAEYDGYGNVTALVNELGARTTFAYDTTYHVFPTSMTNALLQATTATWDVVCGQSTQSTDLNGQATTFTYDNLCRLITKTSPGGTFETHSWVNLGNAQTQYEQVNFPAADGTNQVWGRQYFDGLSRGWRKVSKGPDASTGDIYVDTSFNARGSIASTTAGYYWVSGQSQPTTYATTYGYDALDRPTRVTYPDAAYATASYALWSVTNTDPLGRSKTDRFNAFGNRVGHDETVGGVLKTTSFAYDARQNLQQVTDPAGNVTTQVVDSLGRLTQLVDIDWGTTTYAYDAAGRLISTVDAKSQTTTFDYDDLDRKIEKTTNAGTGQASSVGWDYDEPRVGYYNIGALTTVSDAAGTKTFDYDVGGHVVRLTRSIGAANYTFSYGYDAGDRLRWTTYPDSDTLGTSSSTLTYDSAGRLKSIPGYVTSASYDADGRVTQINNTNGTVTTRSYSAQRGWLNGIATTSGATTIQNLGFARNAKGLLSAVTSPSAYEGWSYTKDELDRMTVATNTSSASYSQTLSYDAIGNVTSNTLLGSYAYHATKKHAVTTAGANTYTYDATGAMISGAGRTMTWNGDNQLATVTSGGVTMTMTYDADGDRIQQVRGSVTTHYVGDDYEVSGGVTTKYVSLGGVLVARKDGTTKTWLHTDQLGSLQAETDASGVEVLRQKYRPFGDVLVTTGSLDFEPRGYTAQRHDGSGLIYLHARFYDPTLGRFISPDRIIDGIDTVGLNRYAYTGNNPADNTDVSGFNSYNVQRDSFKATPTTKAPAYGGSHDNNPSLTRARAISGGLPGNASSSYQQYTSVTAQQTRTVVTLSGGTYTTKTLTSDEPATSGSQSIRVRSTIDGGTLLSTQHSSVYFAPPPPPPPPPGPPASGATTWAPSAEIAPSVAPPSLGARAGTVSVSAPVLGASVGASLLPPIEVTTEMPAHRDCFGEIFTKTGPDGAMPMSPEIRKQFEDCQASIPKPHPANP